jgi:hypothetical protein
VDLALDLGAQAEHLEFAVQQDGQEVQP